MPDTTDPTATAADEALTHVGAWQEIDRLRALLRELLTHDEHRNGPWTMGMRARVREAIGE